MATSGKGMEDIITKASNLTVGRDATEEDEVEKISGDEEEEDWGEGKEVSEELVTNSVVGRIFAKNNVPRSFCRFSLGENGVLQPNGM